LSHTSFSGADSMVSAWLPAMAVSSAERRDTQTFHHPKLSSSKLKDDGL
jgi:hypothetical protein